VVARRNDKGPLFLSARLDANDAVAGDAGLLALAQVAAVVSRLMTREPAGRPLAGEAAASVRTLI
jgi:hypothetical protein